MNQQKFRASFTILDQWTSGNWEMAVKMYFKLDTFVTPAMQAGREWHQKWAEHVIKTKTMPVEFGAGKLTNPMVEQKTVVQIDEWLDLVGIIDCYDTPTIYEWKSGKQSSEVYAGGWQGGVYAILGTYSKKYVEKIEIHHFDQYSNKSDMSIVWVTDELLANTYNWLITNAGEMHDYFLKNDLYNKFGRSLPDPTL